MRGSIHEMLEFRSDIDIRRHFFVEESFAHPAKLHLRLLQWILERYVPIGATVLDAMAGSGSVLLAATQQRNVIAYEVEPRWIHMLRENAAYISERAGLFPGDIIVEQRDARQPWKHPAHVVLFSPPSGNEASSSPLAHRALIYKQLEGRRWKSLLARAEQQHGSYGSVKFHYGTHPGQVGHLRGQRYWQAMRRVYMQAYAALRPHGYLLLIVKDHIRSLPERGVDMKRSSGGFFLQGPKSAGERLVRPLAHLPIGDEDQGTSQQEQREGDQGRGTVSGKMAAQLQEGPHDGIHDKGQAHPRVDASKQSVDHRFPFTAVVAPRIIHPATMNPLLPWAGGATHAAGEKHSLSQSMLSLRIQQSWRTPAERTNSHGE